MRVHLMHIPKTGGITVYRALQASGVDISRSHDPSELAKLPTDTLVITVLRNPVERVWSLYRYQKRQGWFTGDLRAFLDTEPEIWWWGVRNVQARYMRPGLLYDTTPHIDRLVRKVCALCGVQAPDEYGWHGRDNGEGYTVAEYAMIAAVCGDHFYGDIERGW